ncbi:hypothetical protein EXQ42_19570 [Clostridium botulinum]|nr:hypothetical protein [Clostridium botulinum]
MGVTMMKEKILNQLQNFSKGMFVPVLILPIAGIIIAIGNILTNAKLAEYLPFLNNGMIFGLGKMLSGSLVSILTNLGIIFCVGLAVGLSKKKKAEAGFTSLLVFLVFINAMNIFLELNNRLAPQDALRGSGQTMVLGVQVLDMGVFLGIILGIVVAYIHNRFCEKEFDGAFQIYGGSRLVFIILIPITVFLAIILSYVWPSVQYLISSLGNFITGAGDALTAGVIYSIINKKSPQYTCEFATACSVLKHSIHGDANLVNVEEVENFISNGIGRISR